MKFGTDIRVSLRVICNNVDVPLTFPYAIIIRSTKKNLILFLCIYLEHLNIVYEIAIHVMNHRLFSFLKIFFIFGLYCIY